ncbi:hypothetical protein Vqi01_34240 [Micromonospora qiuiae]|uniref:Uncharacterized protein n=1 Tax=Micromonospora qiuiae TaxID=502268 RepID=A0ABQ4JDV0_9ACTN|nr:hypothetical protein [Micromonospora qiuiae]GIJ28262.1 hypothetical protein Vqi01_34240 [Micromonospora qiuiae]
MTNDAVSSSAEDVADNRASKIGRPLANNIGRDDVPNLVSDLASLLTQPIGGDSVSALPQDRHLRRLAALMAIRAAADDLATAAAFDAAKHGAMYPAIGEAAGITRQAARVRWPGLADLARKAQIRANNPDPGATKATPEEEF